MAQSAERISDAQRHLACTLCKVKAKKRRRQHDLSPPDLRINGGCRRQWNSSSAAKAYDIARENDREAAVQNLRQEETQTTNKTTM
jgi:hypothetical protein